LEDLSITWCDFKELGSCWTGHTNILKKCQGEEKWTKWQIQGKKRIAAVVLLYWNALRASRLQQRSVCDPAVGNLFDEVHSDCIYWLLPISDWLDSLIGPSGLLLVVSHLLAVSVSVLWVGVGNKLVTKTWMWEIFLHGHILSDHFGGDAL
jgi:hypothetical protein